MRVKVGDTWYDSKDHPINIQLSPKELEQVANNGGSLGMYAQFPDNWGSADDMRAWMTEGLPTTALAQNLSMFAPIWWWKPNTRVRKVSGSSWQGKVVGYYMTKLTPIGYAVESEREPGSVQIYPVKALEVVDD